MLAMIVMFVLVTPAHATLITRGTGTSVYGTYNLIYDDDLDITWYDYTNAATTWQNQVTWAGGLSVSFGGDIFDDWRLPTTVVGAWVHGYDGTTTGGYNITTSEMGHLFYTELVNLGRYDTSGTYQSGYGLNNTGDFQNLISSVYWSGTESSAGTSTSATAARACSVRSSTTTGWQFVPAMLPPPPLYRNPQLLHYSESALRGWRSMA